MSSLKQLTLDEWDRRYNELKSGGLDEPSYGGVLSRHLADGNFRLRHLLYDNAPESLRLWNFLLTEEERLHKAKASGKLLVGTMKDLGTIPVLAYAFDNMVAFYPDGAWWIPCVMELSAGLLDVADSLGVDESFCPVRAMLGAFVTEAHFPIPDLLICSAGATCDDFSAIAQRLQGLGHPISWWEIPHRRSTASDKDTVLLPGGIKASKTQFRFVDAELTRIKTTLESAAGVTLDEATLQKGIRTVNTIRALLESLRFKVYTAPLSPLPALEMLIVEMLAIHYCSDQDETRVILIDLLDLVDQRIACGEGYFGPDAVRVFWVNPVADLTVMNLLEQCGGRIAGTEYLFTHALDAIPTDTPPMEALAMTALADPMVGEAEDRARRIVEDINRFGAEALIISKIPGASHCAAEGAVIADVTEQQLGIPVLEIEVPPLSDAYRPALQTRIQGLIETVKQRRQPSNPTKQRSVF